MNVSDVGNILFLALLLTGIPLLVFLLFALCACLETSWILLKKRSDAKQLTQRHPDCENPQIVQIPGQNDVTGLLAHKNSIFHYDTVVLSNKSRSRTVLDVSRRKGFLACNHHHWEEPDFFTVLYGNRRSSTPTPTAHPFPLRPKSPFESCGSHIKPHQRRHSNPISPTMYVCHPNYSFLQIAQNTCSCSSLNAHLPEIKTYLKFMEGDPSSRQRCHSFSGRSSSRRSSLKNSRRHQCSAHTRSTSPESSTGYWTPANLAHYDSCSSSFRSFDSGTPDWLSFE